jgi:hypothetical protein
VDEILVWAAVSLASGGLWMGYDAESKLKTLGQRIEELERRLARPAPGDDRPQPAAAGGRPPSR